MKSLEGFVNDRIPQLTMGESDYWQPADLLPDLSRPGAVEEIAELQQRSRELSNDLMVVLIGDMITEEALPSYSMWIQQLDGFDRNGEPRNGWGNWLRKWTSEENRHGDLLNLHSDCSVCVLSAVSGSAAVDSPWPDPIPALTAEYADHAIGRSRPAAVRFCDSRAPPHR